jgi:hypothetical protein
MPAHKVGDLLAQRAELRALSHQARRLAELQQVLLEAVPPLLHHATRVGNLRAGTLIVLADNAAVAAKLRQLAPRLLLYVRKRKTEVTGIQVEVQVAMRQSDPASRPRARDLSLTAVNALNGLGQSLKDSPLKRALTRMVRRHKDVENDTSS